MPVTREPRLVSVATIEWEQPLRRGVTSRPVSLTTLEPDHIAAFSAFARPVQSSDHGLADGERAWGLPPAFNLQLARCVYDGGEGLIYIVPGPGSVGFVAIRGEAGERTAGHTRTELAVA